MWVHHVIWWIKKISKNSFRASNSTHHHWHGLAWDDAGISRHICDGCTCTPTCVPKMSDVGVKSLVSIVNPDSWQIDVHLTKIHIYIYIYIVILLAFDPSPIYVSSRCPMRPHESKELGDGCGGRSVGQQPCQISDISGHRSLDPSTFCSLSCWDIGICDGIWLDDIYIYIYIHIIMCIYIYYQILSYIYRDI